MRTQIRTFVRAAAVAVASALAAASSLAQAQDYPSRPIRLIAPTPPGTVTDTVMRLLATELQRESGAVFIVDNRPGALGVIGTEAVMHAPPDGYTYLASAISTHAQAPYLVKNLRYDPVRDFEPVARLALVQWALVADPALKLKDVRELVARAHGNPKALSFGYGAASGLAATSAFNNAFGIQALGVPYKGQSLALIDIAAGRVSYMLVDTNVATSFVAEGKVQALAVASEMRAPTMPGVPTFRELGVHGVDFVGWMGLHAPARTPIAQRQWLADVLRKVLAQPALVQRLEKMAVLPAYQDPDQFGAFVQTELQVWKDRIHRAGIEPQ